MADWRKPVSLSGFAEQRDAYIRPHLKAHDLDGPLRKPDLQPDLGQIRRHAEIMLSSDGKIPDNVIKEHVFRMLVVIFLTDPRHPPTELISLLSGMLGLSSGGDPTGPKRQTELKQAKEIVLSEPGISQNQLAKRVDVTPRTIRNWWHTGLLLDWNGPRR